MHTYVYMHASMGIDCMHLNISDLPRMRIELNTAGANVHIDMSIYLFKFH